MTTPLPLQTIFFRKIVEIFDASPTSKTFKQITRLDIQNTLHVGFQSWLICVSVNQTLCIEHNEYGVDITTSNN